MRWTIFILAFMVSSKVKADCPPEEWGYEDSNGESVFQMKKVSLEGVFTRPIYEFMLALQMSNRDQTVPD